VGLRQQTVVRWASELGGSIAISLFSLGIAVLVGCGNGTAVDGADLRQPQILIQPVSVEEPIGLPASFAVMASGGGLHYEWKRNGVGIPNLDASAYQTPAVTAADAGTILSVSVSNAVGSVESAAVMLTIGARAPIPGDLRFQSVDAYDTLGGYFGVLSYSVTQGSGASYKNVIASPFELGSGICSSSVSAGCDWSFQIYSPRSGTPPAEATFYSGDLWGLFNKIDSIDAPDTVITCLDIEEDHGVDAMVYQQVTSTAAFDKLARQVPVTMLEAEAANQGRQGRVVTALSEYQGQAYLLSYGWKGDPGTQYDVSVSIASPGQVVAAATTLASKGYIITAIGKVANDLMAVVGTKVLASDGSAAITKMHTDGYATVGYIFDAQTNQELWIGER
jgi:hypothetical protein